MVMIKRTKRISIPVLAVLISGIGVSFTTGKFRQQNTPPVVKIINPKNNDTFSPGNQVSYKISVTDKEDGDTRYDEINVKEVLLEVKYVANRAMLQTILKNDRQNDPPGFMLLRTSNCFNCHNFNSKAMGPSFQDIAVKYPVTTANVELLVKHIREGSVNVWGKDPMPAHPDLSPEDAKVAVGWILKNGKDTSVNYYAGTTGVFRTKPNQKGTYVLIASYVDHGLKTAVSKSLKGTDAVVLNGNK